MAGCAGGAHRLGNDEQQGRSRSSALRRAGGNGLQRDRRASGVFAESGCDGIAGAWTRQGGGAVDSPVVRNCSADAALRRGNGLRAFGGGGQEALRGSERAQGIWREGGRLARQTRRSDAGGSAAATCGDERGRAKAN